MNLVYFAAFFLFMLYVFAPLYIMATQKMSVNPKVEPIGEILAPALAPVVRQVEALGFENVGYFVVIGLAANVTGTLAYLVHRTNGDSAIVISMVSPLKTVNMIEFATRFADQSAITTGNSGTVGSFKRPKNKPVFHYPYIQDPKRLYAIHQGAMRTLNFGAAKDPPARGHEAERLIEGMQREMADQVPVGILRRDEQSGAYRPTLYGAFYMTWGQLPPFKQVKGALRRSRAERMRKEVESEVGYMAANL
jgi:hypothetical protein